MVNFSMNIFRVKRLTRPTIIFVLILGIILGMSGCSRVSPSATAAGMYFDTFITITGYDDTDEEVLNSAIDECKRYELIFSKTNEDSELYAINNRDNPLSKDEIKSIEGIVSLDEDAYVAYISEDMYTVANEAIKYCADTENAYNPALGGVIDLWDYHSDNPAVPAHELVEERLKHTNISDVSVFCLDDSDSYIIEIIDNELKLDFGGIAKGYIANKMRDYLVNKGCNEAVIALGGNIYCVGDKNGVGYKVGVQRPFGYQGESALSIEVANTSVVTSGVYERHFEVDGHMYHHIISSETGFPVENQLYGVTVVCEDSLRADVLSTALICMGEDKALEYIDKQNDIKVIMNFQNGSIIEKGF